MAGWSAGCILFSLFLFLSKDAIGGAILPGWFVSLVQNHPPSQIVLDGGKEVVLYTEGYDDMNDPGKRQMVTNWMNAAQAAGLKVILDVHSRVEEGDMDGLTLMVNLFKDHPALNGWYTSDEPSNPDTLLAHCQTAYNNIRTLGSTKPVFICFADNNLDVNYPYLYRNAYDVMMFDKYPFGVGDKEFRSLEDIDGWRGWKTWFTMAYTQAQSAGRPLYMVLPAFGEQADNPDWNWRLPTLGELRFMATYSMLNGAKGISLWSDYRRETTLENMNIPYPFSGALWLLDVGKPVLAEINTVSAAVEAGPVADGVTVDHSEVLAKIYQDQATGYYYVLSVNTTATPRTVKFTLALAPAPPPAPPRFHYAVPLYEASEWIPVQNGRLLNDPLRQKAVFTDTFTGYQVHTYRLQSATVYFYDNMENYSTGSHIVNGTVPTVGSWQVTSALDSATVYAESGAHGKTVKMTNPNDALSVWALMTLPQTQSVSIRYDLKTSGYTYASPIVKGTNGWWSVCSYWDAGWTRLTTCGEAVMQAIPGDCDLFNFSTFDPSHWYNVVITLPDMSSGRYTYDVKVIDENPTAGDNVEVVNRKGEPMWETTPGYYEFNNYSALQFYAGSEDTSYFIDNVEIVAGPSPVSTHYFLETMERYPTGSSVTGSTLPTVGTWALTGGSATVVDEGAGSQGKALLLSNPGGLLSLSAIMTMARTQSVTVKYDIKMNGYTYVSSLLKGTNGWWSIYPYWNAGWTQLSTFGKAELEAKPLEQQLFTFTSFDPSPWYHVEMTVPDMSLGRYTYDIKVIDKSTGSMVVNRLGAPMFPTTPPNTYEFDNYDYLEFSAGTEDTNYYIDNIEIVTVP